MDCRGGRVDVVRGSRLLTALLDPFTTKTPVPLFPSLLVGRNGLGPLAPLRCRDSRSRKYILVCDERLLVGV